MPTQQMSLLDVYLLLKQQQQKQELQQQQLLRQQLLSQVLTEQHALQRFAEQSYGQVAVPSLPVGNSAADHLGFQPARDMFQIGSQNQVPNNQDTSTSNFVNIPPIVSQGDNHITGAEASIHLPHQMVGSAIHRKGSGATPPEDSDEEGHQKGSEDSYLQEQASNDNVTIATSDAALPSLPAKQFENSSVVSYVSAPDGEVLTSEHVDDTKLAPVDVVDAPKVQGKPSNEPSGLKEAKSVDSREVKKTSEKKSKKKSSKAQSSDSAKAASKTQQPKQPDTGVAKVNGVDYDMQTVQLEEAGNIKSSIVSVEPESMSRDVGRSFEKKHDTSLSESTPQVHYGQRAWKPAPGFKPKSLLEIQQEEQRRAQERAQAQAEMVVSDIITSMGSMNVSTPWAGVVGSSDKKSMENKIDWTSPEASVAEGPLNQRSKKSQLHDLLAGEVPAKPSERDSANSNNTARLPMSVAASQSDIIDDGNFIEAKETKKSRKKSAKAKAAGSKVSAPVAAAEIPISSSPNEKAKNLRQAQQEKDLLPAVPSGPSLGDFVVWKGETTSSPAPAWCTDSGKLARPTSLRDILKEQEKKVSSGQHQIPVPTPQKSASGQSARGNGPSWSSSASSPAKAASPIQIVSHGSLQSKNKADEDLFWGPIDHPKQATKQSDFSQVANQKTPGKGVSGVSSGKSLGGRTAEASLSSSPSLKGKRDVLTKHSEAADFRDWCESECVRLIGTKDTSFLEFCLKQSRSEAEILLKENLGSYDPDHEFIDKFLNYKDFIPSDVLEIAFQNQKLTGGAPDPFYDGGARDSELGGSNAVAGEGGAGAAKSGGGKKRGKKGKKVSPAVLGFNVVSNRIMMGEIQTIDD